MEAPPEILKPNTPVPEIFIPQEKQQLALTLDNKIFNFTIEYNDNFIHYKIKNKNDLYFYDNFYCLQSIQNILDLSVKTAFDKIIKIYIKAFDNSHLSLIKKNNNENIIILRLKRLIDYEENLFDLQLTRKNLSKDELIQTLFDEIKTLKSEIQTLNNNSNDLKNQISKLNETNNYLKMELKNISEENKQLRETINTLKDNKNNYNTEYFKENPKNLKFNYDIVKNNHINNICNFDVYISFRDNIAYLVYGNKNNNNIEIYNLIEKKLFKSLKGHLSGINSIDYFINNKNKKEYLVSSEENGSIIIWDINDNYKILHNIFCNYKGCIFSCLLLFNININNRYNDYIIASSNCVNEYTKMYSAKTGEFIKNINNTDKNNTDCLILWKYNNFNYIIELCWFKISINNIETNDNYAELKSEPESYNKCGFIYKEKFLLCSSIDGFIKMWNLVDKNIIKGIEIKECEIFGILQWSENYLICANYHNNSIDIIDINFGKVVKQIKATHQFKVAYVKKINHPELKECLLSAGFDNVIKLWRI